MSKARELASLGNAYSDGALSNRNLIINGAMQVAQRGTSQTSVSTFGYKTVDRWKSGPNGFGIYTNSQEADGPAGFANSVKWLCTTADTSPASSDYMRIDYGIEAQDLQHLGYGASGAKDLTLSFWVKSNVTATYVVWFYKSDGTARHIGATYTVDAADTWEYKTITITGDSNALGAIDNNNGEGLLMCFCLSTSTDNSSGTLPSTWENYVPANRFAGQTASIGSAVNNYWQITGVQLEVGDTATPFEHRSYGQELALCQRYFNRYSTQNGFTLLVPSINGGTTNARCGVALSTKLRATPTVTPSASNAIVIRNHGSFSNYGSTSIALGSEQQIEPNLIALSVSVASGLVAASINIPYINTGHYLDFDAEL